MIASVLFLLAGCGQDLCAEGFDRSKDGSCDPIANTDTDTDTDSDTDTDTSPVDITASVFWGSRDISLVLKDGKGRYLFGIAETGEICDADSSQCWSGEDCIYGYGEYRYCHPTSPRASPLTMVLHLTT
jgi:hypothetical protein